MKPCLSVCLLVLAAATAMANVRAPFYQDGSFGGHPAVASRPERVVLVAEDLQLRFPCIELDGYQPDGAGAFVEVRVAYRLRNTGSTALSLPVAFLAVDLAGISVAAGGVPLAVTRERNGAVEAEFLVRLTGHRLAWQRRRFRRFFSRIGNQAERAGRDEQNPAGGASILEWVRAVGIDEAFRQVFDFQRKDVPLPLAQAAFRLPLPPGETRLVCSYRQRLLVDEVTTRYSGISLHGGYLAFEYLLYPAEGWRRDPAFRLTLALEVPDLVDRGLLRDRWFAPQLEATHPLGEGQYDAARRVTRYGVTRPDFGGPVFGVLLGKGRER